MILGETGGVLQLPDLLVVQRAVSVCDTLVCSRQHQHLLLSLRSERVALIPRLGYYLPLATRLYHHRYHVLIGRGPVVVFKLPTELLDLSDLVVSLVRAQIE